jgi:flagellum-specific peptidoglycan hydrolase FlgJ
VTTHSGKQPFLPLNNFAMFHASRSLNFSAVFLINIFCALKNIQAQPSDTDTGNTAVATEINENIRSVSLQIADTYGANIDVVESFVRAAVVYEESIGIPTTVVIGIAVYESSFNSYLFLNSGNPFGIKAGGDWAGPVFVKHDDGADTPFRVYITAEEALLDFGTFVRARGWYADALACSRYDYACVVDGLKRTDNEPGYSSNPLWDEKVLEMIDRFGLEVLSER